MKAAELIVWAGSESAWDAVRSARPRVAIMAFHDELGRALLAASGNNGDITIADQRTLVRNDSVFSRIVLEASSPERLESIYEAAVSPHFMQGFWKPNTSALLFDGNASMNITVIGKDQDAPRIAELYETIHHTADGRVSVQMAYDPRCRFFRYEGADEAHRVLQFTDAVFLQHAPSPRVSILGKSVLLEGAVEFRVQLHNGAGKQAEFEAYLKGHDVAEVNKVSVVGENPHFYNRSSELIVALPRGEIVPFMRVIVGRFRRNVGTIGRAFVMNQEV